MLKLAKYRILDRGYSTPTLYQYRVQERFLWMWTTKQQTDQKEQAKLFLTQLQNGDRKVYDPNEL